MDRTRLKKRKKKSALLKHPLNSAASNQWVSWNNVEEFGCLTCTWEKSSPLHCSTSLLYSKRCWIQVTLRNLNGTSSWDEWFLSFLTRNTHSQRKVRNYNKQRKQKRKIILEGVNMILNLQQVKNPIVWKIFFITLLWTIERNNTACILCLLKFVSLQEKC